MRLSAILAPLIAAQAPHDQIMAVVLAYEAEQTDALEKRRRTDAERQASKRERDKSRDITLRHSDRSLTGERMTRVEDKTSTTEIEPQKKKQEDAPGRDVSEFKAEFADLDAERLGALIKHRRAKHGQITGHAARLFRMAATNCGVSIAEAVDICIDRNWITLKPDWLNKPNGRAPPSQAPTMADVFQFAGQRQGDERQPEDFGSDGALVPYLSVASQRRQ